MSENELNLASWLFAAIAIGYLLAYLTIRVRGEK